MISLNAGNAVWAMPLAIHIENPRPRLGVFVMGRNEKTHLERMTMAKDVYRNQNPMGSHFVPFLDGTKNPDWKSAGHIKDFALGETKDECLASYQEYMTNKIRRCRNKIETIEKHLEENGLRPKESTEHSIIFDENGNVKDLFGHADS